MDKHIFRQRTVASSWLILPAALAAAVSMMFVVAARQPMVLVESTNNHPATPTTTAFSQFRAKQLALPEQSPTASFLAVGDIMLSRDVATTYKKRGGQRWPFDGMRAEMQSADFVFGNLETPITAGRAILSNEMVFRSDPDVAPALRDANVQVVSLANNHTPNFGAQGLRDTFRYLQDAGIAYAGAGNNLNEAIAPAIITKNGIKIAFLAFNDTDTVPDSYGAGASQPGTALMDIGGMTAAVQSAKVAADIVIVSMHSGIEYTATPNTSQSAFAHAAIDAGAALVIGHHPHVVQTVEEYKGKYILYSLGNFIFDQMWSSDTQRGMTVRVDLDKKGVTRLNFQPMLIEHYGQPIPMSGSDADAVIARLQLATTTGTEYTWNGSTMTARPHPSITMDPGVGRTRENKTFTGDLNADGALEQFALRDGIVKVLDGNGKSIWQSDASWWVDDALLADANNDGITDLILSVWKSGNFGKDRPSSAAANDPAIRNHLFLFDLKGGKIQPVWQSSNLDRPNCALDFADLGNGKQSLVVLEGDYVEPGVCSAKYLAVWHWQTWGFVNDWRSEQQNFRSLHIQQTGPTYTAVTN